MQSAEEREGGREHPANAQPKSWIPRGAGVKTERGEGRWDPASQERDSFRFALPEASGIT